MSLVFYIVFVHGATDCKQFRHQGEEAAVFLHMKGRLAWFTADLASWGFEEVPDSAAEPPPVGFKPSDHSEKFII